MWDLPVKYNSFIYFSLFFSLPSPWFIFFAHRIRGSHGGCSCIGGDCTSSGRHGPRGLDGIIVHHRCWDHRDGHGGGNQVRQRRQWRWACRRQGEARRCTGLNLCQWVKNDEEPQPPVWSAPAPQPSALAGSMVVAGLRCARTKP